MGGDSHEPILRHSSHWEGDAGPWPEPTRCPSQWPARLPASLASPPSPGTWPLTPSSPSRCSSRCWPLSQLLLLLGTHPSGRPKVPSLTGVCLNRRSLFRDHTTCSSWQLTYLLSVLLLRVYAPEERDLIYRVHFLCPRWYNNPDIH